MIRQQEIANLGSDYKKVTGASGAATKGGHAIQITTESLTTAAGATFTETLTNSSINTTDIVLANVTTSGNGTPVIATTTVTKGQVVLTIQNIHASAAFNAPLVINLVVIKTS